MAKIILIILGLLFLWYVLYTIYTGGTSSDLCGGLCSANSGAYWFFELIKSILESLK